MPGTKGCLDVYALMWLTTAETEAGRRKPRCLGQGCMERQKQKLWVPKGHGGSSRLPLSEGNSGSRGGPASRCGRGETSATTFCGFPKCRLSLSATGREVCSILMVPRGQVVALGLL